MKWIIIALMLLLTAYKLLLEYLDYSNRNAPIPENVVDIYDEETYAKQNAYERACSKLSLIEELAMLPLFLLVLVCDVHSFLFAYAARFSDNVYVQSFFMHGVLVLLSSVVIGNGFAWYRTFTIEEQYGFNKTTRKTFVSDAIKSFLVGRCLVMGGGLALFMYLYISFGDQVFVLFFMVVATVLVLASFFSHAISKLFNQFAPLDDGSLKDKIFVLAKEADYPIVRILVMDGSKRSTKLNAYFTGFGKSKTIVLFDTLLEKMDEEEILAVLAHEIGHAKHKHTLRGIPIAVMLAAAMLYIAQFFVGQPSISIAFGFQDVPNVAFGLYISLFIASPLLLVANLPLTARMRKFEYVADAYAAQYAGADPMISALKKLARENFSNLTPHPLVVKLTHSHPTISQRVAFLNEQTSAQASVRG